MNSNAIAAKQKSDSAFMKRGVIFAVMSGVTYGLYTAFLTLGQASGIWGADWYGANEAGLSVSQLPLFWHLWALLSTIPSVVSGA